jgi:two-component system chemotaxis response regulator CheB
VLLVDDSAIQRTALIALLDADPELVVIGWAADAMDAVRATAQLKPDVIAMDLGLPGLDGLEATRLILRETPTPIVLITADAARIAQRLAFEALEAGVLAVLSKPGLGHDGDVQAHELRRTLKTMAQVRVIRRWTDARMHSAPAARPPDSVVSGPALEVVAIGGSTGGPQVLRTILVDLPPGFEPPVLVVQHIADGFASGLVDWLQPQCRLPIQLAADGEPLNRPGIWVAPTGWHLEVRGRAIALTDGPPVSLHRPSATQLFQSVAREYGQAAIGVLLSGMGDDGAAGLGDLKRAGATTIAQDEASSVVFSMPSTAIQLGVVDHVVPPQAIAPILLQRCRQ